MQFWPRKRAKRAYPRIRNFSTTAPGLLAFAGYKMGMTQVSAYDTDKNSLTKNELITIPVTLIECPSLRLYSVRGYVMETHGLALSQEIVVAGKDKHLARKAVPKTTHPSLPESFSSAQFSTVRVLIMTQPSKTGIGQKRPEIFEVQLGGKTAKDQLAAATALVGKEIKASDLFKEGDYIDLHAVTTGRGFQGPVKRFGIGLKSHKSEKGVRRPGSLGGWSAQQHVMYRVPMAGQMGFHQRVQYNNQILKITSNPDEINVKGGFIHYGEGRKGNEFIAVSGSVPGPRKRMIALVKAIRLKKTHSVPTVDKISLESNQGK